MKYSLTYRLFGLLLALAILTPAQAQWEDLSKWQYFINPEHVNDLLDKGNTLWMATEQGVVAWDKTLNTGTFYYAHNSNIPKGHVSTITEDADGQVWIGTYDNMLSVFDGTDWINTEVPFPADLTNPPLLYTLEIGPDNRKWIGTNFGLVIEDNGNWTTYTNDDVPDVALQHVWDIKIDPLTGVANIASFDWAQFDGNTWTNLTANSNFVFYGGAAITFTQDGSVWSTNFIGSIGRYKDNELTLYETFDMASWSPGPPLGNFISLYEYNGDIYLATQLRQIYKFENEIWVLQNSPLLDSLEDYVDYYMVDASGKEWAGKNAELFHLENNTLQRDIIADFGLGSNIVRSFSQEPGGKLYLAEASGSIFTYETDGSLLRLNTPMDTFPTNPYIFQAKWNDFGEYWVGTFNGLYRYEGGIWTRYHDSLGNLPSWVVTDFEFDEDGQPWIITPDGLFRYENNSQQWLSVNDEVNLPYLEFRKIIRAQDGSYWLLEQYNDLLIHIEGNQWSEFNASNAPWQINDVLYYLMETLDGAIWVIENYSNFQVYQNEEWTEVIIDPNDPTPLFIYHVSQASDGRVLASTNHGIYIYDGLNWEKRDTSNAALLADYCILSMVDAQGALWISCPLAGISRMGDFIPMTTGTQSGSFIPQKLEIAPNPASDAVKVTLPASLHAGRTSWQIVDVTGRQIDSGTWNLVETDAEININTTTFPRGWYAISIQQGSRFWTGTILIEQ